MGTGLGQLAIRANGGGGKGNKAKRKATIIEFVESPDWGLGLKLHPVQRVILKAHYGLALDTVQKFPVAKDWTLQSYYHFTEAEYLEHLFNEGRSNIKTVDHERHQLVLPIGRRSGKCILGDSLVLTDAGIHRIEELGDPNGPEVQALTIGVAQEGQKRAQSACFYNGGQRSTRTLTTCCGYQLGGTDNHRIKVLTEQGVVEWKYLADLVVGDVVCIHRGTDLWASKYVDCTPYHNSKGLKTLAFPDRLTEEWGRLLGYLVGDGLWNYKGRVEITVEHDETWETLKELYTKLLGGYSVSMDKRTKNTGALKFGSVGMRAFLHDLGFRLGTDRDAKMVPWAILRSPRSVVQAFLRGLFEADGGVESGGKSVTFSTASGRLAREVQALLLNLGIVSRICPKSVKGKVYWILAVRGLRHRKTFAELVGFDSHKKMDPLIHALGAGKEGGNSESIPHQRMWCSRLLRSVPKVLPRAGQKQEWSRSLLREVLGNTIKPSSQEEMTYPRLGQVLAKADALGADEEVLTHFRHLQDLDYFYDPVEEIEEGFNPVYDLNVPDGESFVANGMTNHNTFLAAAISAYETYKLLLLHNPQQYYGIPDGKEIGIVSVATAKDQAGILYRDVSAYYKKCGYFSPYMANNTSTYAAFQTPADISVAGTYRDNPKAAQATIKVSFYSCIAKGLRGTGNMIIIMDEFAHFTDGSQQSSAKSVYDAITPSTATFSPKDENNQPIGDVEGRIITISSPLGRQGHFFKLYEEGMRGVEPDRLCIQAPTWEVNPTLPASYYVGKYREDPTAFMTEFGAEFTDRTRGWIERPQDLEACIYADHRPTVNAPARRPHFVGIDVGLVNDGSAVAIGHLEKRDGDKVIVLDHLDVIQAGVGDYAGSERLEFDEVVDWIHKLSRRFYMAHGVFDQHVGIPFEQALAKKGLRQLVSEHYTDTKNSEVFRNFKDMLWDRRLVLYDWPKEDGSEHCGYLKELLELQAEHKSKYVTKVFAPQVKGKHDDRSDALVRMVWLASQHIAKPKYITNTAGAAGQISPGMRQAQRTRAWNKRNRMGTSPDRQSSRTNPGRIRGRF